MSNDFDKILDECIDRLNRGESVEACVSRYPEHADRLRPLLSAMAQTVDCYKFEPSAGTKMAAKRRFQAALEEMEQKKERGFYSFWLLGQPRVWATAAAVVVIALVSAFVLRSLLSNPEVPTIVSPPWPGIVTVALPDPQGNFVFLISDEVNAIGDFQKLGVTVAKVYLQPDGQEKWIEFEPAIKTVDLTLLQGEATQEIWKGNIPEDKYNKVVISVSDVRGILKDSGKEIEIKLPSDKLQISLPFQVGADELVSFTYDLTVVAAGNQVSGTKYILKPQADQSGGTSAPKENRGKDGTKPVTENSKPSTQPVNLPPSDTPNRKQ